jgi:hypothetical protein
VIGASLYIIVCTARNRLRLRLKRLREPRYLLGGIVGAAYLYFSIFGRFRAQSAGAARRRARGAPATAVSTAAIAASGPAFAGLALMILTAVAWILPFDSGLLEFSNAETQFLFPAPVSRRSLLLHRMLRSQIGILFGSVIVGFAAPSVSGYTRLRVGVGMWLLMCVGKVYFTGVSLARARLGSGPGRARRVAWLPLATLTVAIGIVGAALTRAFLAQPPTDMRTIIATLGGVSTSGLPRVILAPFMAVAWPLFARWPQPYLVSLLASAAVLAVCIVWVLQVDETFQDAAEQAADRKAKRQTTVASTYRARTAGFRLAPTGRAEMAFAWKAAMQTVRSGDRRTIMRLAAILFAFTVVAISMSRGNGFAVLLGIFTSIGAAFSVLMAPQAIRMDIRQDLQHLELLKTWPVGAAAVVRGELLWPGALITAISWTMIALATVLSAAVFTRLTPGWRLSIGSAAAIVAPALVFAQLVIHNGVALMFPAWVPLGQQRARGLDAIGQRLIMLGGTWLLLIVMTLPAAIAGGIIWFAFARFIGPTALVPAALACTAILAIEVLVATEALGPLYEKIDLLAVERAE